MAPAAAPAVTVTDIVPLVATVAVLARAEGEVNVHVVTEAVNPGKATTMTPLAGRATLPIKVVVIVTPVATVAVLDKVTAAEPSEPAAGVMDTRVPVVMVLMRTSSEVTVRMYKSVLASCEAGLVAPVQVKVTVPAATAVAEMVTVKRPFAYETEAGSEVLTGAVNLQAGLVKA